MADGSAAPGAEIVVIDDSADDIYFFQRALRQAGAAPARAFESGRAALEHLLAEGTAAPGMIFLDIKMPVLSGFEVLAQARATPRLAAVPIVMLSGSAAALDQQKAAELGATGYLVKPAGAAQVRGLLFGGERLKARG